MSLRLRVTLLNGILTGSTILLFALVFYLVLRANLFEQIDERLHERADLMTRLLEADSDGTNGSAHIPPLVEFDAPGIYVELIGSDGQVRVSSPNLADGRPATRGWHDRRHRPLPPARAHTQSQR
jgi:hypothetical protein